MVRRYGRSSECCGVARKRQARLTGIKGEASTPAQAPSGRVTYMRSLELRWIVPVAAVAAVAAAAAAAIAAAAAAVALVWLPASSIPTLIGTAPRRCCCRSCFFRRGRASSRWCVIDVEMFVRSEVCMHTDGGDLKSVINTVPTLLRLLLSCVARRTSHTYCAAIRSSCSASESCMLRWLVSLVGCKWNRHASVRYNKLPVHGGGTRW